MLTNNQVIEKIVNSQVRQRVKLAIQPEKLRNIFLICPTSCLVPRGPETVYGPTNAAVTLVSFPSTLASLSMIDPGNNAGVNAIMSIIGVWVLVIGGRFPPV